MGPLATPYHSHTSRDGVDWEWYGWGSPVWGGFHGISLEIGMNHWVGDPKKKTPGKQWEHTRTTTLRRDLKLILHGNFSKLRVVVRYTPGSTNTAGWKMGAPDGRGISY